MTQPEEVPAEPVPNQPAAETPQAPAGSAQSATAEAPHQQPGTAPLQTWPQQVDPAAASQPGQMPPAAFASTPTLSPEEQAAIAAKKAKRRSVIGKSVIIAVPAVLLVGLLAGTSIEASAYTGKTHDASTAAKAATAGGALSAPIKDADSAAEKSILVDAGCVAVESQATSDFETKIYKDSDAIASAEKGTSLSAFISATDKYLRDLQAFSTALQQDGALSKRDTVKTALATVSKDLGVLISAMQQAETGNLSNSTLKRLEDTASRMDDDSTAVDTMCGGTTLNSGGGGDGASGLVA